MRSTLGAITIGIIAGAALFFFPFLFRVLFVLLIISLIFRWVGFFWWRRRWHHPNYYFPYDEGGDTRISDEIIPIDGRRYRSTLTGDAGASQFPVK